MDPIVIGAPEWYYDKFLFVVWIAGFGFSGFNKATGLKADIQTIKFNQGGTMTSHKSPGMVEYERVTLTEGATGDQAMWEWFNSVVDITQVGPGGGAGRGLPDPQFRREVSIVQLTRTQVNAEGWVLRNAWPASFVPMEGDSDANEKQVRTMELEYEGFFRRPFIL